MNNKFNSRVPRNYIGTYRPRIDGLEKASGKAEYIDDITLERRFPGMLHAKVLRSPHPHARIKGLDLRKAEEVDGVVSFLTYDEPEVSALKPTNAGWTPGSFLVSYDRMFFPYLRDRKILGDHVRWVGDGAGVVVAAETEEAAEEALRMVDVEWEVLPFVIDPIEAMKSDAPLIHSEINPDGNILPLPPEGYPLPGGSSRVMFERGDLEKTFSDADAVIKVNSVYHNTATAATLDHWCCMASWNEDQLTVWSNNFAGYPAKMHLSEMLGIPLHKVRVIVPFMGGSFGRGDSGDQPFFIYTSLLARKAGRPVKFRHTRREDFLDTRTGEIQYCKMSGKKDGTITGIDIKLIGDAGAYADHTEGAVRIVAGEWIEWNLGHIPAIKAETCSVYTNRVPSSCKRGIGNIQVIWLMSIGLDELAEKLDIDPIDLAVNSFQFEPFLLPNKNLEAVLKEGAKRIGWEKRHKPGEGAVRNNTNKRGLGFSWSHSWHPSWNHAATGAIQVVIRINPDGTVHLEAPTIETGPGANACAAFSCADSLGVPLEDVKFISGMDTETMVRDTVQTGSRVSHILPEAIHVVAQKAKRKLFELASSEIGCDPDELDIKDGSIFQTSQSDTKITIAELMAKRDLVPIVTSGFHYLPTEMTGAPYAAAFVEVEVDIETGELNIIKMAMCNDCGTVMYPSAAEAQQIGGQAMGIGEGVTEEIIYDEKTGIPLNFNFIDYKILTMADFPDVEPVLMEEWKGSGEYGACGIGESVASCAPAAIANAVYNAIGVRILETPITPDKILKALAKI